MCGSFTCSKNTLVGLNLIYMLVSLIMIGVAVHGKVSGIVTSLPIVGGITACGVFLLFISVVGLVGALRHHQVMLFFYMVVLFLIFLIQFSVACAALAINEEDEKRIILKAWDSAPVSVKIQAERSFDCCGVGLTKDDLSYYSKPTDDDKKWSDDNGVFNGTEYKAYKCYDHNSPNTTCLTCFSHINEKVNSGFNAAGGLGLFFSLTELFGVICTHKYRLYIRDMGEFA